MVETAKKIRVFIAVKAPEAWCAQIREIQSELKTNLRHSEVKWVEPENMHITLRFLGYIFPAQVQELKETLNQVAEQTSPFVFESTAIDGFPSLARARVLWIGVQDLTGTSLSLQDTIGKGTELIGEKPEDRPFTPHLTLARIKRLDRGDRRLSREPIKLVPNWEVSELLLMQSHLSQVGSRYEILDAAALRGGKK